MYEQDIKDFKNFYNRGYNNGHTFVRQNIHSKKYGIFDDRHGEILSCIFDNIWCEEGMFWMVRQFGIKYRLYFLDKETALSFGAFKNSIFNIYFIKQDFGYVYFRFMYFERQQDRQYELSPGGILIQDKPKTFEEATCLMTDFLQSNKIETIGSLNLL